MKLEEALAIAPHALLDFSDHGRPGCVAADRRGNFGLDEFGEQPYRSVSGEELEWLRLLGRDQWRPEARPMGWLKPDGRYE